MSSVLTGSAGNEKVPRDREIRRQLIKELTAFLKLRGTSDNKKPDSPCNKTALDTTSPAPQKNKKASLMVTL